MLSGLPKDPQKNGLDAIGRDLLDHPKQRRMVLALVDCSRIVEKVDTGEHEPTVRILRIEQVAPDDQAEAERLVRRALEHRSGDTVLPIDIERDLESWFGKDVEVDTTTGVVKVASDDGPDARTLAAGDRSLLDDLDERPIDDDEDGES